MKFLDDEWKIDRDEWKFCAKRMTASTGMIASESSGYDTSYVRNEYNNRFTLKD